MMQWPARLDVLRARLRARPDGGAALAAQRHGEGRALADAGAAHVDVAAVQPHEIVDDRQPEPETAVAARRRAVGLAEAIEHVRQERAVDADAGVGDLDANAVADRSARDEMRPPAGVNLTAFDSRFQSTCCRRVASASTFDVVQVATTSRIADALGLARPAARCRAPPRAPAPRGSGSSSTCSFPVVIRDMSTRSLTSCACAWALRSISSSACWRAGSLQMIGRAASASSRG